MGQVELQSESHISLMSCTFAVQTRCHVDGNMNGNDMQMKLCIVKRVGVEMHVRSIFPSLGFIKGSFCRFWHTHGFINLKKFTHTQI